MCVSFFRVLFHQHSSVVSDFDYDRVFVGPSHSIPSHELPSATIKCLAAVLKKRFACDEGVMATHLKTIKVFHSWKSLQITDGGDRIRASLRADSVEDSRDASWCLVRI
jgi:hypothetical protein